MSTSNNHAAIAMGTQTKAGKSINDVLLNEAIDDEGHAQCLNILFDGQFIHSPAVGWLHYTGTYWTPEGAEAAVERAITETLTQRAQVALSTDPQRYKELIGKCVRSHGKVTGIKGQLQSLVYAAIDDFDSEPDLLNCKNGAVNLRTGAIIPHSPSQRFLSCSPIAYKPNADCVDWMKWLDESTSPEEAEYLQMAVGYTLTGHTSEEVLFFLYGPSRSGKGTFARAMQGILGDDYAKSIPFATFTNKNDVDSQNFALAPLQAARFIAASENERTERFNAAKVKSLTGGDRVRCSFKGKDQFEYAPKYKIWLFANFPVNADVDDDAVWGRVRLITFPKSHLGHEDKSLKAKMSKKSYLEGVLAWAVEGAKRWYALGDSGLPELKRNAQEKQKQRDDQDTIVGWFTESYKLTGDANDFYAKSIVYLSYKNWCVDNGRVPKAINKFVHDLLNKPQCKGLGDDKKYIAGKQERVFTGLKEL